MKVSELKERMFIVVDEPYNYGNLGKYLSHMTSYNLIL